MILIKNIKLRNFKAHKQLSASMREMNVFVGPNNAGKSTILDGLRALAGAIRYAKTRIPTMVSGIEDRLIRGYIIPLSSIPINISNLRTDYSEDETFVEVNLADGNKLILLFKESGQIVLCMESEKIIKTTSDFKKIYPLHIKIVPTLGPFEEEEKILNTDYVNQWKDSRRSHRMFRNIWYRETKENFERFRLLVEETWSGASILKPEFDAGANQLNMFSKDGRIDREIAWSGFGFQIWLQILTHIVLAKDDNILVIDEPEIYLHPDLQHRLINLLKNTQKQIMLATHSAEMINEAEQDDVLIVEKNKKTARRVTDIEGLQSALFSIGAAQNIHLAKLSKGKKILFFEGKDFKIIRKIAHKLNLEKIATGIEWTVVPIEGYSNWKKVENTAWAFEQVLKAEIKIAALFDRDYRCEEETKKFLLQLKQNIPLCSVLERKEIENYLLIPKAISKAICDRLKAKNDSTHVIDQSLIEDSVVKILHDITNAIKPEVCSQITTHRIRHFKGGSIDDSTIMKEAIIKFEKDWIDLNIRLNIIPGKQILSDLNTKLQEKYGVSVTDALIIRCAENSDFSNDLGEMLTTLEKA